MPLTPRAPFIRFLLLAGVLIGFFASATPTTVAAKSAPFALDGPELKNALVVSDQLWGARPCGGDVELKWDNDASARVNAISRWTDTKRGLQNCSITFNKRVDWTPAKFCTIVVHELGHLNGHPHVDDPDDIMSPAYTHPFAGCETAAFLVPR